MTALKWWQKGVFYQIYPRSFASGRGQGVGDFPGICERLDYLQQLGIDGIWLSPHYPSPLFDCGYDIADYTAVAPEYGTLDDFRQFLDEAHRRGIRVILDLVLNHTSDRHSWFQESRSSRADPKRDWYIWRDGRNGGPPNNWASTFGGSAWKFDPETGQYYYHFFFEQQPDLNWRNPAVKQAMFNAARFWLDMGVDGFRLDAIETIFENPDLPDHQLRESLPELRRQEQSARGEAQKAAVAARYKVLFQHQLDQPGMHQLMRELRQVVDEYPDRMLVGESETVSYCGNGSDELHMVFNFPLMRTRRLTPAWVRANQAVRLSTLPEGAWPCNTLGNHDSPRVLSRYGDGPHDQELARLSLALMLTLRGTPFLYYGEEIGMTDLQLDDIGRFRDTLGIWHFQSGLADLGLSPGQALEHATRVTRDKCRTPMQWSAAPNAGFCPSEVEPWLPVHPNHAQGVNVAAQEGNAGSMLNFYRRMLRVRRQTPALITGSYTPLHLEAAEYLAFLRTATADADGHPLAQTCLVVLNYSERPQAIDFTAALAGQPATAQARTVRVIYSSCGRDGASVNPGLIHLSPFEVLIAEICGG